MRLAEDEIVSFQRILLKVVEFVDIPNAVVPDELVTLAAQCVPTTLADKQNYARTIVANDTTLFWVSDGDSTVRTCSRPACADVRELPLAGQTGLAIDRDHVYWSHFAAGWVQSCPLTSCVKPLPIAQELPGPGSIALDDANVYVATAGWNGSDGYQARAATIVTRGK